MPVGDDLLTDSGIGTLIVTPNEAGWRCDKFLAIRYADQHSRTYFHQLIAQGHVQVDGKPLFKKSLPLPAGAEVEVHFAALPPTDLAAEALPLAIVYEDEHLVVIDKAAGMVVHPAPGHSHGTLVNALLHHCRHTVLWQEALGQPDCAAWNCPSPGQRYLRINHRR